MLVIVVTIVAVSVLLLLLGAILRYSLVSGLRTKDARLRLRNVDVQGVERVCGFAVPSDLIEMYRTSTLVELVELSLADNTQQPSRRWSFAGFYPLTGRDVQEQRKIHGVSDGIPIAADLAKGVYFVPSDGRIMFRPPGRNVRAVEVARSARHLAEFEVVESDED